jgi:hypothetical protein
MKTSNTGSQGYCAAFKPAGRSRVATHDKTTTLLTIKPVMETSFVRAGALATEAGSSRGAITRK